MAKSKSNIGRKHSAPYIFAAILLAVIYAINTVLVQSINRTSATTAQQTSRTMNAINQMNSEVQDINIIVLRIVSGTGDSVQLSEDIDRKYGNIKSAMGNFEHIEGISDTAKNRYNYAKSVIDTYFIRLKEHTGQWNAMAASGIVDSERLSTTMRDSYKQDIYPLQVTASEMLQATISVVSQESAKKTASNVQRTMLLMGTLLLVAVLGEVAILIFGKRAKRARLELEEREKNLAEVGAKLKSTRQKASDMAVMNMLTGMKNRYALDGDVSERLESDRFNIAVFDMDNFRSINDTYGYDFGDEYLSTVADKLKEEFGGVAEIYNITGNEFCFLFNKEISESQAMGIVQNIQSVMSSPFEVLNLAVQLPCSGAVYHYLPGDCLNVNSLLVKLDTAMRNAKMNGGNMINTVVNI